MNGTAISVVVPQDEHSTSWVISTLGVTVATQARRKRASCAGILSINGFFEKGDVINVIDEKENVVSVGLAAYASKDVKLIAGSKSNEIEKLLGYHDKDVIIHRDDMVLRS